MKYARLATEKEMLDVLSEIDVKKKNIKNGIPILWSKGKLYVDAKDTHTLLIGGVGSGKTQSIIMPYVKTSILANESMVINDKHGEIYIRLANKMQEENYNIYAFNFENSRLSLCFNPLEAAYSLFKEKNVEAAYKLIENLGYTIFQDNEENDPYWTNTTIDFFKGLVLYLFSNATFEEINLSSVHQLAISLKDDKKANEFINKFASLEPIYILLSGTLLAPFDTRASIISVFNSKMKEFLSRENLAKLLANTDFKLSDILKEKFVIFINGSDSPYSEKLTSILIYQIYYLKKLINDKEKVNFILDDFDEISKIYDLAKVLNNSRSFGLRFLCVIKSYTNLNTIYDKYTEIIKMCFENIIYLRSNDLYTMEEISRLCGEKEKHEPLISVEELKHLKIFEAIIFLPRRNPFKIRLIPDYKIDYGYEIVDTTLKERELPNIKIYKLN